MEGGSGHKKPYSTRKNADPSDVGKERTIVGERRAARYLREISKSSKGLK